MKPTRRNLLRGAGAIGLGAMIGLPAVVSARDPMTNTALALLESIGPDGESDVLYPFDGDDRTDWHFTPRSRIGLSLDNLSAESRDLVFALLATALSEQGLRKAEGVIQLEGILGELTNNTWFRDPEKYFIALFGRPNDRNPWAWRFEGHHLSISVTVAPGSGIAVTPAFFGTNPAEVGDGHEHTGLRVLKREHDLAFDIVGGLNAAQRSTAVLQPRTFGDILTGPGREDSLREPQGLPLADMTAEQRTRAVDLVEAYVRNMRNTVAEKHMRDLRDGGLQNLHFAWAGSITPGAPHYYRLHGPTIVIEYDNTQSGGNHAHSVWHDPRDGFGRDLLRRHHEHDHKRG